MIPSRKRTTTRRHQALVFRPLYHLERSMVPLRSSAVPPLYHLLDYRHFPAPRLRSALTCRTHPYLPRILITGHRSDPALARLVPKSSTQKSTLSQLIGLPTSDYSSNTTCVCFLWLAIYHGGRSNTRSAGPSSINGSPIVLCLAGNPFLAVFSMRRLSVCRRR
jgi:hypothetical protein